MATDGAAASCHPRVSTTSEAVHVSVSEEPRESGDGSIRCIAGEVFCFVSIATSQLACICAARGAFTSLSLSISAK